jgi:hypothetical protein
MVIGPLHSYFMQITTKNMPIKVVTNLDYVSLKTCTCTKFGTTCNHSMTKLMLPLIIIAHEIASFHGVITN